MSGIVRFASLGSGSKGNGTLIDDGDTRLLIDLGFTVKESIKRLARLGMAPEDVDAILVTHEHGDHIHGVAGFARRFGTPVYLTTGTYDLKRMGQLPRRNSINRDESFMVDSFNVMPVVVPHDAREPCQYIVTSSFDVSVGVLTDLGHITPHVEECYRDCDALLLECNHDLDMLAQGPYPHMLKQRVGGDYGHLNNHQAAGLLEMIDLARLRHLVISHISEQNNLPHLVREALQPALRDWPGSFWVADQRQGLDWVSMQKKA